VIKYNNIRSFTHTKVTVSIRVIITQQTKCWITCICVDVHTLLRHSAVYIKILRKP